MELEPVKVWVYELTLLGVEGADARLRVHCSGGTYMRSLAHDLGQLLGCGAHLRELRRTASAEFEIAQARTIAQLESLAAEDRLVDAIVPAGRCCPECPACMWTMRRWRGSAMGAISRRRHFAPTRRRAM